MLSAIISTHESERALVPTLAALVPGATAGLLGEVIVADAGSRDATAEVADIAGCRFLAGSERAAVFRPPGVADLLRPGLAELIALLRVTLGGGARPEQGLLIARRHYD